MLNNVVNLKEFIMKTKCLRVESKKGGFFSQKKVFIESQNLFAQLRSLAGNFNVNSFNKRIEAQLSGVGGETLGIYRKETDSFLDVRGFLNALRFAPCEIMFDTGLCLNRNKFEVENVQIYLNLRIVPQEEKGGYRYRATYDFYAQKEGDDGMYPCYPMPTIVNWLEVTRLLAPILGMTRKVVEKELYKSYVWEKCLVITSDKYTEDATIVLQVKKENECGVVLDEAQLLQHPRCPKVYQEFPIGFFENEERLVSLIEMAQDEVAPCKWDYYVGEELVVKNGALGNYLMNVFTRLHDDQNSSDPYELGNGKPKGLMGKSTNSLTYYDDKLCFCTGLQGKKSGNYIYAVCSERDVGGRFNKIEWVENDYVNGRDERLPPETSDGNFGLPYPPNWTRKPEELICQYKRLRGLEGRINFKHILNEVDESRFSPRFFLTVDGMRILNTTILHQEIVNAVAVARKKVQANYRCVIPGYYHGKITLQLPLCLDNSEVPNFYLVLVDNEEVGYEAPTMLTPSMAYYNSRVITPQEDSVWENTFFAEVRSIKNRPEGLCSGANVLT